MSYHAVLWEAKSIQEFLFQSGRLRDVIGASELVDSLTRELLDEALKGLGMEEGKDIVFSRRAGGAFYAFSAQRQTLEDFIALWSLLVQQYAPGLAYDIGLSNGSQGYPTHLEADKSARESLRQDGSRHRPALPIAAPITERSRRTGLAAVAMSTGKDGVMDAGTRRKKALSDPAHAEKNGFIRRFSPSEGQLSWKDWPMDMEPGDKNSFPYQGDNRTVALIHADGNGLGQLLMNARTAAKQHPEKFIDIFQTLSEGLDACTQHAAQDAVSQVLLPARTNGQPLPARPIVLGGDDLTMLVRADLAMPFLQAFVNAFEKRSKEFMASLETQQVTGLPKQLTIGAGIVYLGASQPFYLASHLAESIMGEAKKMAKKIDKNDPPSSVVFQRITTSLVDDYDTIIEREHTWQHDGTHYTDTLGSYLMGSVYADHLPRLDDLLSLQALLGQQDMARGPTRQLLTLIGLSPGQAQSRYRRWRQLMKDNKPKAYKEFMARMKALIPEFSEDAPLPYAELESEDASLPYAELEDEKWFSPLGDALTLNAVKNPLQANREEVA